MSDAELPKRTRLYARQENSALSNFIFDDKFMKDIHRKSIDSQNRVMDIGHTWSSP